MPREHVTEDSVTTARRSFLKISFVCDRISLKCIPAFIRYLILSFILSRASEKINFLMSFKFQFHRLDRSTLLFCEPRSGMEIPRRDPREIPIPQWDARSITAKRSGPWTVFFRGEDDRPIGNLASLTTTEYLTNPKTHHSSSTLKVSASLSRAKTLPIGSTEPSFIDSYTLERRRREREEENQKLYITASASLSRPSTMPTSSRRKPEFDVVRVFVPDVPKRSSFEVSAIKTGPRVRSSCRNRAPVEWNPRFGRRVTGFWWDD
jgi:hypothetical protein